MIQEHNDTTEIWNSWSDSIKVELGLLGIPFFLTGLYRRSVKQIFISGLACYLGVCGLQCKAQQDKFKEPRLIKDQLETATQSLDKA